jgi:hypothetical protein
MYEPQLILTPSRFVNSPEPLTLRPVPDAPEILYGIYLRYAVVLSVCRLGVATPNEVVDFLKARHFEVRGRRPTEVTRSVLRRASVGSNMRMTPALRNLGDGRFAARVPALAPSTQRRWEQRLPTLRQT